MIKFRKKVLLNSVTCLALDITIGKIELQFIEKNLFNVLEM